MNFVAFVDLFFFYFQKTPTHPLGLRDDYPVSNPPSTHRQKTTRRKHQKSSSKSLKKKTQTKTKMQGQDWNPIILSKKRPTTKDATSSKAVNAALRSGAAVETVKKFTAGTNRSGAGPLKDAAKLDRETEELAHER